MLQESMTIINKRGLHARAAAKLVTTAGAFSARIQVRIATPDGCNNWADAKSVMSLMLLAATQGTTLDVSTDGKDEVDAMNAVRKLLAERFEEDD